MNPLGPSDSYLVGVLTSTLVYLVATVSAVLVVGVIGYIAMIRSQLRTRLYPVARGARRKPRMPLGRAVIR